MLMVWALAGTGKTTTSGWGMGKKVPQNISPSDEQIAIVKAMRKQNKKSKAACAFNKPIAIELPEKMPSDVVCKTMNAFGHAAICKHINKSRLTVDQFKTSKIADDYLKPKIRDWKERRKVSNALHQLCSKMKQFAIYPEETTPVNLLNGQLYDGPAAVRWLIDRFDIDWTPAAEEYLAYVWKRTTDVNSLIDYDDQIFMPVLHDMKMDIFDHVVIDECQDTSIAKQRMIFKMAREITAIGDENQAIYGFSGADAYAMQNLRRELASFQEYEYESLSMTLTRRCPKEVVALANRIVPTLRAADDAPDGVVDKKTVDQMRKMLRDKPAMVICRRNAPIVSLSFKLIAEGTRCYIQGRDIGSGLKSEVRKTGTKDLQYALGLVENACDKKVNQILSSQYPDETKIETARDRVTCIKIIAEGCDTVDDFNTKVDELFKDSGGPNDVRLSSGHKAKGLEHERVFIYDSDRLQLRFKDQRPEEVQQEKNLAYVAYTRSMSELYMVPIPRDSD